jgi:hypothetical protein
VSFTDQGLTFVMTALLGSVTKWILGTRFVTSLRSNDLKSTFAK